MSDHPEIIEDEIDRIRNRMEQRVEILSSDLRPTNLLNGLINQNGPNGVNLNQLADTAKANPVATALIGAGIASLMLGRGSDRDEYSTDSASGDRAARVGEKVSELQSSMSDLSANASEKVKRNAGVAKEAFNDAATSIRETASDAAASISGTANDVLDSSKQAARRAPVQAKATAESATDWVKENPVPAGLMALAVGAAVSSFFTSRKTTSRLGASRQLHEEARDHKAVADTVSDKPLKQGKAATKRKPAARKSVKKSSANKPKPIPTRTAKARTLKGKPETQASSAAIRSAKSVNSPAKHGG